MTRSGHGQAENRDRKEGFEYLRSACLDTCELDHFGPFLGFVGDELAKVGGREREHIPTQVGKPGTRSSGQKNKCPMALNLYGSPCG